VSRCGIEPRVGAKGAEPKAPFRPDVTDSADARPRDMDASLRPGRTTNLTLLAASSLTVMSGAAIAPALPAMRTAFATAQEVDLLVRLVLTTPALFIATLAVALGGLVDRIDRRRMLAVGAALFAAAGSSGLWLDHLVPILIARGVLGVSVAIVMTASTALIADYYEGRRRARLLGLQSAFMAFGGVVFLLVGGLLADLSWRGPFAIYLLAIPIAAAALSLPAPRSTAPESPRRGEFPWLGVLGLGLAAFASMLLFYALPTQLPFDLRARLDLGGLEAGAAIAMCNLTAGLVSLRFEVFARRLSPMAVLGVGFGLVGVGLCALFAAPGFAAVLGATATIGLGMGLFMPTLNQWAVRRVPPTRRGTAAAVLVAGLFAGQFVSPLVGQPIAAAFGVRAVFAVLGAAALAGSAGLLGFARRDLRVAAARQTSPKW